MSYAQKKDSLKINKIANSIINRNISSDEKSKSLIELTNIYMKTTDENLNSYIESVIIKSTNLSNELFFHEYELKIPSCIRKNKSKNTKIARLFLILSNKQGVGIDYDYYNQAKILLDGKANTEIKKTECDSSVYIKSSQIQIFFTNKKHSQFNNYYLSLIFSCPENKVELDRIKKFYFLIH